MNKTDLKTLKEEKELTPELLKIKADLDKALEVALDKLDARQDLNWVQKQKMSNDLKMSYEDTWYEYLTDAGYTVSPTFESLAEEFKLYESLWD